MPEGWKVVGLDERGEEIKMYRLVVTKCSQQYCNNYVIEILGPSFCEVYDCILKTNTK